MVDRDRYEGVVIEKRRCLLRKGRERTFEEGPGYKTAPFTLYSKHMYCTIAHKNKRTHAAAATTPTITVLRREDALEGSTSLAPHRIVGVVAGPVDGAVESVLHLTLRLGGARVFYDGIPEAHLLQSVRRLQGVEAKPVNADGGRRGLDE